MKNLWYRALDALELADGISRRWGGFAGHDADRWQELHRDAAAGRWERHFRVSATAGGFCLEPKTDAAATLALFWEILENINGTKNERA